MPRAARVPRPLAFLPFRGSVAVADGLLSGRMLRGPESRRLLPDVYVHASAALDHRTWCDAVGLILPSGAAIGGASAAYLWGVNLLAHDGPVTVVVPRVARMRPHNGVRIVRSTLPAADVTRFAGLPVTTPLRTAFDLARSARVEGVVALDALLHRRVVKLDALHTYAGSHARWPGMPILAEALSLAEPLAESPMETRLRLLLVDAGLPRPVAQHQVSDRRTHERYATDATGAR